VAQALMQKTRPGIQISGTDLGTQLPDHLVQRIARKADDATRDIVRNFISLTAEERKTGVLTNALNEYEVKSGDGLEAHVFVTGFSQQTKEKFTGADIGIIIDIRRGRRATLKAIWIQAKRDAKKVNDPLTLKDLISQLHQMQKYTKESYGVVYTPDEVYAFPGNNPQQRLSVSQIVKDVLKCVRGDRSPTVIANTLESNYVIEVVVLDAEARKLFMPERRNQRRRD
jgi:hypothetical protein